MLQALAATAFLIVAQATAGEDGSTAGAIIFMIVVLALYFLPTIIAATRDHHNGGSIAVINLFLGWTFVGWVVALAWSMSATPPPAAK